MVNFPKYNKQAKRSGTPPPPPQPKPTPPPAQPQQNMGFAPRRVINPNVLPVSRAPAPPNIFTPLQPTGIPQWQQLAMQVMANYDRVRQIQPQYQQATRVQPGQLSPFQRPTQQPKPNRR